MKRLLLFALLGTILSLLVPPTVSAQLATADDVTEADFRVYRSDGTPATMADVRAALDRADVVFVGELHNDPVSHYIEQRVLEGWFDAHGHAAALSLEMFSRDVQYIVDEYLAGLITDTHFQQSSSPWSNYETDYRPLVEFAKDNGLAVIAANAPRRYANMVSRNGRAALRSLSDQARSYLAPLPFAAASERYEAQWNQVMADAMASMRAAAAEAAEDDAADEPMPEMEGMRHAEGDMDHEGKEHGEGHEMADMQHGDGHDMADMQHGDGHDMAGMKHAEGEMDHDAMRKKHHPDMSDEDYEKMKAEHMAGMKHDGDASCAMMEEGGECKMMEGDMEGMDHGDAGHESMDHGDMNHDGAEHKDVNHEDAKHEGMDHGKMDHAAPAEEATDHAAPAPQPQHGGGSMLDAQSLWDATMAWSIAEHMTRTPGAKVAHFVGGFHVQSGTGTPEHLIQYRPGTRMLIISVQSVDDPTTFDADEHTGLGDFVVLGDAALPRTYQTRTR